ncbi:MAG TPA: alpha/beta hydrolase [Gaiellaceae bacterium]|nr:alpha/beta hydrolase [Gaiellaceae bacterium]
MNVTTPDGRTLHVHEGGDPNGFPVLMHHGSPSNGSLFPPHVEDARAQGIRLLGYDRPGYGGSSPSPGRSVGDAARDVEAILDALGIERCASWGISGGGPHVLACAALLPDRIAAAASLAAVAPFDADGLDWIDGMGESNIVEFNATLAGRDVLEQLLEREAADLRAADAEHVLAVLGPLLTPVDAAALTGAYAAYIVESSRDALAPGIEGWVDDDLAFAAPWGFDPVDIGVPLLLWHGDHDLFVPPAHGRWLTARIPGVDARLSGEDGHLTLEAHRVPEVHRWLLERAHASEAPFGPVR